MKPILLLSLSSLLLTGCLSLQPVSDSAKRYTLILEEEITPSSTYAAPVFDVTLPSFLNEGTVWYSEPDGRLHSFPSFVWAESLSRAIRRELALALASDTPFHPSTRINVGFGRFILLSDGSGIAIAELSMTSPSGTKTPPAVMVKSDSIWDPDDPETFLKGYQSLLGALAQEFSKQISPKAQ